MPQRIQLSRRKGWRKPEGAVVVARPTRWGNPFALDIWGRAKSVELFRNTARGIWNPSTLKTVHDGDLQFAYQQHTGWLKHLGGHPLELARSELAGRDLACWCPLDQPCHADVLLDLANPKETP